MATFTDCWEQHASSLSATDRQSIRDRASQYEADGLTKQDALRLSVQWHHDEAQSQLASVHDQLRQQYPELLPEPAAATKPTEVATPEAAAPASLEKPPVQSVPARTAHPELNNYISRTWKDAAAKADTLEANDPTYRQRLARRFLDNPRPAQDFERVSLLRNIDDAERIHSQTLDELKNAKDEPSKLDALAREAEARSLRDDAYNALNTSGSESGNSLNAVKMIMDKYKNVERLRTGLEVAQGKPLSKVQEAKIENISNRIRSAEPTKLVDYSENMGGVVDNARGAGKDYKQYMTNLENGSKANIVNERGNLKWEKDFDPCA